MPPSDPNKNLPKSPPPSSKSRGKKRLPLWKLKRPPSLRKSRKRPPTAPTIWTKTITVATCISRIEKLTASSGICRYMTIRSCFTWKKAAFMFFGHQMEPSVVL